jgi:3-keto-disaccharide hydrolase
MCAGPRTAMRFLAALFSLALIAQQSGPSYSPVQDGEPHGDPPFLIEPGWAPLLNGRDLTGWTACDPGARNEWFTTQFVLFERILGPTRLGGRPGPSGILLNGPTGRTANLCTERRFGDVELYLEFMLAKGSNSGIYLHGLYEIQIFDSWGSTDALKTADAGAIYHQWIEGRGIGGSPPMVNASRRPGEWQSYQAWFRGPRVDASGRRTEPARFLRVLHNGVLVQKDVDVQGPTRAHLAIPEAAENPLMIQGDHGPVALKNIYIRPLRPIVER